MQELNKIEGSLEFEMEQDSNSNFIEDIKKQLMLAPSEEINKKKSKKTKESFTGESILLKMYLESSLCKGNNKLKTVKGELFTTTVNNFQGKTESMSIVITQICKDFIKIPTDKIKKFWHQTGNNFVIILHNEKLEKNEGYIRSKVVGSYSKVK